MRSISDYTPDETRNNKLCWVGNILPCNRPTTTLTTNCWSIITTEWYSLYVHKHSCMPCSIGACCIFESFSTTSVHSLWKDCRLVPTSQLLILNTKMAMVQCHLSVWYGGYTIFRNYDNIMMGCSLVIVDVVHYYLGKSWVNLEVIFPYFGVPLI